MFPFASFVYCHYRQDLKTSKEATELSVIQAKCKKQGNLPIAQLVALMAVLGLPKGYSLEHLVSQDPNRYSTKKVSLIKQV